jgi:hypothetical protein
MRSVLVAVLSGLLLTAAGGASSAAAQRADTIDYVPDPDSLTPQAFGTSSFTFTDGNPPSATAHWQFWGLNDAAHYTVLVEGTGAGNVPVRGTCVFQAQPGGEAQCHTDLPGLTGVQDTRVYQGEDPAQVVLRMQ